MIEPQFGKWKNISASQQIVKAMHSNQIFIPKPQFQMDNTIIMQPNNTNSVSPWTGQSKDAFRRSHPDGGAPRSRDPSSEPLANSTVLMAAQDINALMLLDGFHPNNFSFMIGQHHPNISYLAPFGLTSPLERPSQDLLTAALLTLLPSGSGSASPSRNTSSRLANLPLGFEGTERALAKLRCIDRLLGIATVPSVTPPHAAASHTYGQLPTVQHPININTGNIALPSTTASNLEHHRSTSSSPSGESTSEILTPAFDLGSRTTTIMPPPEGSSTKTAKMTPEGHCTKMKEESPLDSSSFATALEEHGDHLNEDAKRVATLEKLGSSCLKRRTTKSPYFDASQIEDPHPILIAACRRSRGVTSETFPEKLYRIIEEAEKIGKQDIISFFAHGRAILLHNPERFAKEIMPIYFKHARLSSFQRQLSLYGFGRISSGLDAGGYYHELFLRGRPALCVFISRVGAPIAGAPPRRRGVKAFKSIIDPDLYGMPQIRGSQKKNAKKATS